MKKRVISLVLGLCIFSLSACGSAGTGNTAYTRLDVRTVDAQDAGAKEVLPDYAQVPEDGERDAEQAMLSMAKESIEEAGMAYDGIVSYDKPSIDSILLDDSIMSLAERDFDYKGRSEKKAVREYLELVSEFRSYFKEIKVYEPKEGYTIAISAKKLYEYKIADTDEILAVYDDMLNAQRSMNVHMADVEDQARSSKKLFGGISNFKSSSASSASASVEYEAAADCCEAAVAEESISSEAAILPAPVSEVPEWETPDWNTPDWNTEEYKSFDENRFMSTQSSPFSTFGMDVDTASYSNFRKKIFNGRDIPKA